ncbi:NnrU family protein [uncultured Tateyamaria sp.]|uniref:NnrU family protein n=1 Tax=uncultured Tateyamaria sp. TaxID=455651 RepID=UPI00260A305E|nr:NnrU family protein [uncultured Tateyamaria sp.]
MTWAGFAAVFVAFFLTHSVPVRPAIKARMVARFGQRGFAVGYSTLSLGLLALLIWVAGHAPYVELWAQMPWHRHAVHLGMFGACLILAFSLGRPNRFSFGGARNQSFDPAHPGIVRVFRHPVLAALAIWAGLHLLPNGNVAHVLLFGVLGGFALLGRGLINRRKRREMGDDVWNDLNSAVANAPLMARPTSWSGFALRLAVGLAVFAALMWLHPDVVGVSAL